MNIYEKLAMVQAKLKAPKEQKNTFGKYNYRSCEDILEAVKPLLVETKTALIISDELKQIGTRYYVEATAMFFDYESEGNINVKAFAREEETKKGMDGSQITGTASSYARKYALNGMFAIDDTKDSDATNTGETQPAPKTSQPTKMVSKEQAVELGNKLMEYAKTPELAKAILVEITSKDTLANLTIDEYKNAMTEVQRRIES